VIGIVGAVAGAVAGKVIERACTSPEANEIQVQIKNGDRRAIVQAKGKEGFEPGVAVILITTSGKVRVAKAPKM
ncbi:MAG: hypothetical protein VW687_11680, partial [Curvibacter sp.]